MKDFELTKNNIKLLFDELSKELESSQIIIVSSQKANVGRWGMARLWRAWMATTAEWMARNGAIMPLVWRENGKSYGTRPFNKDDAHELFTSKHLLVDSDGTRLSWAKDGHDGMRTATKGERWLAMLKHDQWASERGILLFHPKDSEYQKMTDEQNK